MNEFENQMIVNAKLNVTRSGHSIMFCRLFKIKDRCKKSRFASADSGGDLVSL